MFKRLVAWLRSDKGEPVEEYYSVVIAPRQPGAHPRSNQFLKVARPKPVPTVYTTPIEAGVGRPSRVVIVGQSEKQKKASARAWLVNTLPDECTFM